MPMNTRLVTGRPISSRAKRSESRYWATISAAVRWRRKPKDPVAQNRQPSAQPACEDRHSVSRSPAGMRTDSTCSPSSSRHRCLTVPSDERAVHAASSGVSWNAVPSSVRSSVGSVVASSNERAARPYTQCSTWSAR